MELIYFRVAMTGKILVCTNVTTLARKIYTQYWPVGDEAMTMQNPYWVNYRNLRENKKDRYMLNANFKLSDILRLVERFRSRSFG